MAETFERYGTATLDIPATPLEELMTEDWPFAEAPNLAIITVRAIIDDGAPILFVSHDEDGDWQFLAGADVSEEDARVVGLRRIWRTDPSIGDLADLTEG